MGSQWKIDGTYFETCNCDAACPCVFLSAPTTGDCTALVGWHIASGHFGDLDLHDLNAVMAVHSPGHMAEVPWQAALYVDSKGDSAQQDALTRIFSGQAGGHPAMLASHVGDFLGVKSVAIEYQGSGKKRSLNISGIAAAEIEAISGQGGGETTVAGHPLCIAPGFPLVVARSSQVHYDDHQLHWEMSRKNGFYSPFAYHG
ncbi:DUF1326 domain-containing protein [Pelobacter seleniigenes]|uniref:DUF1326 domain-containing protein n=1 Tax=Pelobacter seleniigenes TaxID=407188 RepID=UPI0004A6BFA7|nr:DUF1326 domain-containing protein [Pelobacter seleniigenes]